MSYRGTTFKVKNYCGLSISDPSQHSVAIKAERKQHGGKLHTNKQ
mgnify:FL=1